MDAAFDDMMGILNESSESSELEDNIGVENEDYNADLQLAIEQMRQLEAPQINIVPRREMIEVAEFDPENNVLDPAIREEFKTEVVFEETHIFTQPVSTTNTMEGYLSNVSFHEQQLIQELMPDENLVLYRCNYGKLKYDGYTEPVKQRKTNRGRKKKAKKKKLRKKQGEGIDFNSQITFVALSTLVSFDKIETDENQTDNDQTDKIIPVGSRVYKFKIFRTGKLQLPGVHQHLIDDVVACTKKIAQVLNFHLHPGETNPLHITNVININPVMKNYKFIVKLPPGHIIDMDILRQILQAEKSKQFADVGESATDDDNQNPTPDHPPIFMLKYTRQDTKLSVKFSTPIYKKPKKRTRINIFMRGKINILGAFQADITRQICEYLHWVFEQNYDRLVVPEGLICNVVNVTWQENIEQFSDDETMKHFSDFINWLPDLPYVSNEEYDLAMDFISGAYDEIITGANDFLERCFAGSDIGEYLLPSRDPINT